jgi:hypothetical protein
MSQESQDAVKQYLTRGAHAGSQEVMSDPILGKLLTGGQAQIDELTGDIAGARGEAQDLASRGYQLTDRDREAYGQAAGNISREFGQAEGNLAQALASRGLSRSGSSNRAFMGSGMNKLEALGQMQRQIADDRVKTNMQRLAQTRNFMSGLLGQRTAAQGQQEDFARGAISDKDRFAESKAGVGQRNLQAQQGAANLNYRQRQATAQSSPWSRMLGGVATSLGGEYGGGVGGAMGGAFGEAIGSSSSSTEGGRMEGEAKTAKNKEMASGIMGKMAGGKA